MDIRGRMDSVELSRIRAVGERVRALGQEGREIVPLHIGEPDFCTPAPIRDAAKRALDQGHTHYAPNRGLLRLRRAISQKLERENGVAADPEREILVTSGCAEALFAAFMGLVRAGDEVLLIDPSYIAYQQLVRMAGGIPVFVHAQEETGWLPDVDALRRAVTARTRAILICSPCNPTGAVYPRALLERIAALACEKDLLVFSDEVYEKLVYGDARHVSIAALPGMAERTVTINGFSKAYAMTGWRLGYAAARAELLLPMLKVHQYAAASSGILAQHAGIEALENGADQVERMRLEYDRRRRYLADALADMPGILCAPPAGTFYIYPNVRGSGMCGRAFCSTLLETYGIAAVPGGAFDSFCDDHIRISYASSMENLEKAVTQMRRMLCAHGRDHSKTTRERCNHDETL